MEGFVRTKGHATGVLWKAYRDGLDWRVVSDKGETRYFSVWQSDVEGSLYRALSRASGMPYNEIVVCGEV